MGSLLFVKISNIINTFINSLLQGNKPSAALNGIAAIISGKILPGNLKFPKSELLAGVVVITYQKLKYIIFRNLRNIGKDNKSFLEAHITCALIFFLINLGNITNLIGESFKDPQLAIQQFHLIIKEIESLSQHKELQDLISNLFLADNSLEQEKKPSGKKKKRIKKKKKKKKKS